MKIQSWLSWLQQGWTILQKWRHKKFRSASRRRLEAALCILQTEIKVQQQNRIPTTSGRLNGPRRRFFRAGYLPRQSLRAPYGKYGENQANDWQALSKRYLDNAGKALDNHDPELGWSLFKAAYRCHLYSAPDLQNEASIILREAKDEKKKLSPWRKESIISLLSADEGKTGKQPPKARSVVKAQLLLDEQLDNMYYKQSIVKGRLQLLVSVSALILIIWLFLAPPISIPTPSTAEANGNASATPTLKASTEVSLAAQVGMPPWLFWLSLILAGMLGATISGFTGAIRQDVSKSRIPDELSISTVTFARLGLAGVSAVAISLFLTSGLINGSRLSYELLLASAVAAGFSEQFLIQALEPKA